MEFTYGGATRMAYPEDPESADDARWARSVFFRPNPRGKMTERWVHTAGCRRWFTVTRDSVTHEVTTA
jgi:heterotetrameric sarcosine oxidase delta subunit